MNEKDLQLILDVMTEVGPAGSDQNTWFPEKLEKNRLKCIKLLKKELKSLNVWPYPLEKPKEKKK